MEKLKAAIIGCGMIVEEGHLSAWARLSDRVTIAAIADRSEARLKVIGDRLDLPPKSRFTDYGQMLRQAKPDFADIALPHHLHRDAVSACCEAGVSVLLEKPVALEMAEVEEIVRRVKESSIKFSVIHNYKTIPLHASALARVSAGDVGKPYLVRSEAIWAGAWPGAADGHSAGWRSRGDGIRVGAIQEYAYHNFYLAEAYMQSPVKDVQVRLLRTNDLLSGENIAVLTLGHENGGVSVIQAGVGAAHFRRADEIHGSSGSLELRFGEAESPLVLHNHEGESRSLSVEGVDDWGFDGCFAQFVDYLSDKAAAPGPREEAERVSRLIHRAYC